MTSIYDKTLIEGTLFEIMKTDAEKDTVKALRLASVAIQDKILKTNGEWTKKRLNAVKSVINDEISKSYGGLFDGLNNDMPKIANIVSTNMLGEGATVPTKVIDEITSPNRIVQGYSAKELFKVTQDNHARQLRILVGAGVAQGKTAETIAREIGTKNTKLSRGQLKNAIFTYITESRSIVRYNAYEQAEKQGFIDGYEYVSCLDSATTEYCRNHDGRRYFKPIKQIQRLIKTHWHCRSEFVGFNDLDSPETTRASMFGQVPKDETYATWFPKQSKEFQKTVLGKKYNDYVKGSYVIGGLPDVVATGTTLSLGAVESALSVVDDVPDIDFGYDGKFNGYVADIRDEAKIVIDKLPKPKNILFNKTASYNFSFTNGGVISTTDNKSVFLHEYGHHLDIQIAVSQKTGTLYSSKKLLLEEFKEDRRSLSYGYSSFYEKYFNDNYKKVEVFGKKGKYAGKVIGYRHGLIKDTDSNRRFSDLFDAMSQGELHRLGAVGHGVKYYKSSENILTETFANLFSLYSDDKDWEKAKKLFPSLTLKFEEIIKGVNNE